jgi:hypothetical protein
MKMAVFRDVASTTLKMEAANISGMLKNFYQTEGRNNPE